MGLGLRKLKSEKDMKAKLRKQPRASEDSSTASSRHQRIPSIAPVLPLPSHIRPSALPTSTSDPSSHLQVRAGPTARSKSANHQHRRSRSFSALTSLISPTLSSFDDQPWRSRDAWLAIHARAPSPPPTTAIPSARGGSEAGWRRKGNGGFFARELAGVGETALPLPYTAPTRPGAAGRSHTMIDLAGELERPDIRRQASEPTPAELHPEEVQERTDAVAELNEWKPGFATSLFRKKTQCVPVSPAGTTADEEEEEIVTPPPPVPSRPESRILPESPPPPPAYRRPRTNTQISSYAPVRTASTGSASVRTSQSSSIHTYESADHHYRHVGDGLQPPPDRTSDYTSPRSSSHTSRSSAVLDGLPKRSSSLFPPVEDLPTIITPTSTYYHFTSPRSSTDGHPTLDFSARRGSDQLTPLTKELAYDRDDRVDPPREIRSPYPRPHNQTKMPHQQHLRDESLPALLPPSDIPLRDARRGSPAGGERMKGIPWARAQAQRPDFEAVEGAESRRGSQAALPSRQRVMERVREMDEGQYVISAQRKSGTGEQRRSQGGEKVRRGSDAREAVRGGWV